VLADLEKEVELETAAEFDIEQIEKTVFKELAEVLDKLFYS
jgi:hypothetical protein